LPALKSVGAAQQQASASPVSQICLPRAEIRFAHAGESSVGILLGVGRSRVMGFILEH
jgi:hypothetical protein